jgi:acyl carrier protein
MQNESKYSSIFAEAFDVDITNVETLSYQSVPAWDSVGHMAFIALLEERFQIQLDTDDIIDFSSYTVGKQILRKHGVDI